MQFDNIHSSSSQVEGEKEGGRREERGERGEGERNGNEANIYTTHTCNNAGSRYGRTTFRLPTGVITSPQYPLNYQPSESCDYEIRVKPGHDLILRTPEINIPSQDALCTDWREDRIQVLMKKTGSKIYTNVMSFCGQNPYPKLAIKGASSVLLKFRSNSVREGRFLLQYDHSPAESSDHSTASDSLE